MADPPRLPLAFLPTPLEYVERLTEKLGGPKILVKRDDQTGLALGGNKVRKLEYIIPDLKSRGVDTIITTAGVQSNWARQTTAAARKSGMKTVLVLRTAQFGKPPEEYDGNLLLNQLMGADIRVIDAPLNSKMLDSTADGPLQEIAAEYRKAGSHPEVVNVGKADGPVSTVGYVKAAEEIIAQTEALGREADYVILSTGLGGSYAGLLAGFKLHGRKTKVIGVDCGAFDSEDVLDAVIDSGEGASHLLGSRINISSEDVEIHGDYTCGGYGKTSQELIDTIKYVAETEGLLIDPVYTGKAMLGFIDLIRKDRFRKGETVVFVHTGGLPALFPYRDAITGGRRPSIYRAGD